MPRKKPFSAKQKKQQLQERRKRKEGGPQYARDVDADQSVGKQSDGEEFMIVGPSTDKGPTAKPINFDIDHLNQQPVYQKTDRYDPNRYRLQFFKEKEDIIRKRKEKARHPYQVLSEDSLELDVDLVDSDVIDIPKRPAWDYSLSKQRLEANENRYFKDYVDNVLREHDGLSLFELNLETWRQLWRVLEMSDVFLLITDIRHPAIHFPPALYTHITEVLKKDIILVLNKVDLAPPALVTGWQQYFKSRFPLLHIVCFTSFPKTKEEIEKVTTGIGKVIFKKRRRGTYRALGPRELLHVCAELVSDKVDLSSWKTKIDEDQGFDDDEDDNKDKYNRNLDSLNEETDCSFHNHERFKNGVLTIGCIGYPNVGKSSVLNGLVGKKVVSVSKTPGHTKHFQTIYLTSAVRLCDSPGLVFPSKWDRTLQVLAGIYPISQVREPYSVVEFLAVRCDLPALLRITHPDDDEHREPMWTAMDICHAWAEKKGFLTARANRADTYRAANNILNLAVDGRVCLCFYPPGFTKSKEKWLTHQDTLELIELQHYYRQKTQASADLDENDGTQSEEEPQSDNEMKPVAINSSNPFDLLREDE